MTLCSLGLIGALAIALAGCGGSTTGGTGATTGTSSGCVAGTQEINGVNTRQFCGPAKAQATANGQTMNWSNGECATTGGAFSVNIGRIILGSNDAAKELKKQYDYFGITLQATSDGTYDKAVISMDYQGQSYALITNTLTLSGGMKQGTFTGNDLKGVSVSGSFTC
ncbi:MAG TPA: hypothetical protein VH349_05695 [Ktedonobacterales bacterium]